MSRTLGRIASLLWAALLGSLAAGASAAEAPTPSPSPAPESLSISLRRPDGHWSRATIEPDVGGVTLRWRRGGGHDEKPSAIARHYDGALLAELRAIWGAPRLSAEGLGSQRPCIGQTTWTVESAGARRAVFCQITPSTERVSELFEAVRAVLMSR